MQDAAALMDRMYRHQRHIYDLTRKPYLLGRDRLIECLAPTPGGAVLEVGCGTARNLICAARAYRGTRFYGVDVSPIMLDQARHSVERAGLSKRITLAQGDASCFDPQKLFGRARFERIFISYALSMIPPWQDTLSHAFDLLAEDGSLHIVDFGDQADLPVPLGKALSRWLALFHVTPRRDMPDVIAALAQGRGYRGEAVPLFRGYAVKAVVERPAP